MYRDRYPSSSVVDIVRRRHLYRLSSVVVGRFCRRPSSSSSVVRRRRPSSVVVRLKITCKTSLKHPSDGYDVT